MDQNQISCIAVDDEPSALRIIEAFAKKVSSVKLKASFKNPVDALTYLQSNSVQLMFLDINMPDLSGIEFMKSLKTPPLIILTTAYEEYALESYEYQVIDYLLKPIAFPRFLKAINKASEQLYLNTKNTSFEGGSIILKDAGTLYNFKEQAILYLESMGNYLKVMTDSGPITIKSGLQEFITSHQLHNIYRVHKSFAVNIDHISKITNYQLFINEKEIPIGRKFKDDIRRIFIKK
ncbi:LytR/AlgR family response regulator transcription factor [Marinigracilibium pacificum]|uniref:Response regulator transcription factor n=1 Tax=Marinigracilibium pacificum TaxID=2729599 RepID=A0A848IWS8_9BACT|nr:response regulator transcription factor [Marinigracilibium pacificum]NMM47735.1 response regulator transcription factor [Marinigracilibium pacificum]